jgi:hypothetical protein
MKTTKLNLSKTKSEAKRSALSIESPIELENNNNVGKDMPLFGDCIHKFSDIEIKFILTHFNKGNVLGRHINRTDLKDVEQAFILKVVNRIVVAEYGSILKNIIEIKLVNSINQEK